MSRCKHVYVEQHTKTTIIRRCTTYGTNHFEHSNMASGHKITWSESNVHDGVMA